MTGETLVLSSLAAITAPSVEHNSLAPREFMLARMATLIEVDAPPAGLANAEASTPEREVILVPEDPPPDGSPGVPTGPGVDRNRDDVRLADGTRLTGAIVGHITDQARRTVSAARAGRVVNAGGEPGVLDLTPLRELLSELVEELQKVRLRDRVARTLRQAADIIDSQTPSR